MKKIIILIVFALTITGVGINTSDFAIGQSSTEIINQEIKTINDDIQNNRDRIKKIQNQQEKYSDSIKEAQSEKSTLNSQLAILDNRMAKSQLDIEIIETRVVKTGLEIQKINLEIKNKNKEIAREKENVANVLKLMHKKDNVTALEILLLNNSLADFLSEAKYLEDINEGIKESLAQLENLKNQLEKKQDNLSEQKQELSNYRDELVEKKSKLEAEKDNKLTLLTQVSESESEYQRLLALSKKEQEEAAAEIASMEKLVRAKLAKLNGEELEFNDNGLVWPVPKNVITSYFHDPDYPFKHIFEHPAVDIRAGQGTPLRAAASGYVARTKYGAGGGYGYIMLIHGDGLSTVYGHSSKIFVKEDEYVVQGQVIGHSGGLPGTPGAGRLTTGPHLHFEVRLNGIPVDPLSYLP